MDVTASVDAARDEAQQHLATFARQVEAAVVRELPRGVNKFLAALGGHVDALASAVSDTLARHTAPFTAAGEGERMRSRFARDARLALAPVGAYAKGYVDGGAGGSSADLVVALVSAWAEPAVIAWLDRVISDFEALEPAGAPAAATAPPAPAGEPAPAALDLATLLARAATLGIRIKNVPEKPTQRYLEKLAEQLADRERKAPPPAAPAPGRKDALLAFAEELKIRVKAVPDSPSASWLDKMEEKLREVAERKGVAIPPGISAAGAAAAASAPPSPTPAPAPAPAARKNPPPPPPPPAAPAQTEAEEHAATPGFPPERYGAELDDAGTPLWAPDREEAGVSGGLTTGVAPLPPSPEVEADRRQRVEALLEKAAEAGLEIGRVPPVPSEEWIEGVERKLESAIEKRKAERKAERKRKEAERQARIQLIKNQAARLGIDLGQFPPFPTDDWLARAEQRIQAAALGPAPSAQGGQDGRAARLRKLLADASDAGADLGEVPPDPDDEWLDWAEAQLQEQKSAAEGAIALVSEAFEALGGFLVYEEGTVQEQSWQLQEEPITVGRGRGNTVHVRDDAGISRQHFTLWTEGGRWFLRDEGSTKGTQVQGKRVSGEIELKGDELILASETQFVFRLR
jgi:pSer/pThr/pTyr-binding forkhead associated (FHA) protein